MTPETARVAELVGALEAEHLVLDAIVDGLPATQFERQTPAEGWRVRDQLTHLAFVDERASMALTDPDGFAAAAAADRLYGPGFDGAERRFGSDPPAPGLLAWWREARRRLDADAWRADPHVRVGWYGPPMSLASFVTARLMETWAHGRDVADALGAAHPATDRLVHVADLGVRTRGWSYVVRGLEPPRGPVRVVLRLPSGATRAWGDEEAAASVVGPAEHFCLVVTQRINVADTDLVCTEPPALEWMQLAQAYAGAPGPGRPPRGSGPMPPAGAG